MPLILWAVGFKLELLMKASIFFIVLISSFSFNALAKESVSGSRVGIGYAEGAINFANYSEHGVGYIIEYGYDLNNVVSLNASFTEIEEREYTERVTHLGVDLGYAISAGTWKIKPYGDVGLQYLSEKSYHGSYDDTSPYIGLGVRAWGRSGIYFDSGYRFSSVDGYDLGTFKLTIGYKF